MITARNPVHAALHLVLAFFTAGGIWALLQAEFLAIALVLVYVGAVMVLFLFVVMMLDINLDRLREGFWSYLPLGAIARPADGRRNGPGPRRQVLPGARRAGHGSRRDYATPRRSVRLMFTDYVYPFELASVILLVGIIAAIVLTYRGPKQSKYTNPAQQVFVKAKDRVRVLQMPAETKTDTPGRQCNGASCHCRTS